MIPLKNLMDLTHDTKGVIYFPTDSYAYAADWSGINGFPVIRSHKVTGLDTDIPAVDPTVVNDLLESFSGVVSFIDYTPEQNFRYVKNQPWLAYEFDVCGSHVVVFVENRERKTITAEEYAKKHNLSIVTVYWQCKNHKIPCVKIGHHWEIFDDS